MIGRDDSEGDSGIPTLLGVAVKTGVFEVYGLNRNHELALHGWFPKNAILGVLINRPLCTVALVEGSLPPSEIAVLEQWGHHLVIVPRRAPAYRAKGSYSAKALCQLGGNAPRNGVFKRCKGLVAHYTGSMEQYWVRH